MPKQKQTNDPVHTPVLLHEVIDCLSPHSGQSYLDLTAGYGGHASPIIEAIEAPAKAVLVDRDENAREALQKLFGDSVQILDLDFLSALKRLASEGHSFDMILADLGVSSPQIEEPGRGFSFNLEGPLDMRMDRRQAKTAADVVNQLPEQELAAVLSNYGEEPRARAIARAITSARPINDSASLAAIIANAVGWRGRRGKIHPATRSFQAIRIAVNDELTQLAEALPLAAQLLNPGGRLAVISFHSLEDRTVKQYFAEHSGHDYDSQFRLLTKKPITASPSEIALNPRARSAKLRAVAKIKK